MKIKGFILRNKRLIINLVIAVVCALLGLVLAYNGQTALGLIFTAIWGMFINKVIYGNK